MTRMRRAFTFSACAAALLGGCSLVPDYSRPDLPVASNYPSGAAYKGAKQAEDSADSIGWREFFADRRLQTLIYVALRNNRDLRVAVLNVAAAQAQFRVQRSELFPQISASAIAELGSLPANAAIPESPAGIASGTPGATASPASTINTGNQHVSYQFYNPGIGFASYELDVFGRLRSLTSEAFEQYLGYEETARSAQISLVAEVASGYLAVLADRDLLKITQDTLVSETASYELTNAMFKRGATTLLSLRQAETAVDTARTNLALYTRQEAQDENALVLLLGEPMPADLPPGKGLNGQGLLSDLPAGLPSDLLFRRPDIVAAEHDLIAANANIGAARAAFFPSISLTGSGGVAGTQLSRLFTKSALTWSFEPQITLPIFTGGQNEANLDLAHVQKNIQVAQYEKAIQTAFREVSDALAARTTYVDQVKAQRQLVNAAADSLRLSTHRFRAGVDDYLPVLQAQETLYSAQQTLLGLNQARLVNLVTLYKALGGWHEHAAAPATTAQPL
ncbi:MAG: efflux transporter outer membrane subunit [Methylocella sp.]